MGEWNDTFIEDYMPPVVGTASPFSTVVYKTCPYCSEQFVQTEDIFAHIRSIHRNSLPFLCVNGKILKAGEDYDCETIDSIFLYPNDYAETLRFSINGNAPITLSANKSTNFDLSNYIPNNASKIEIELHNLCRCVIWLYKREKITNPEVLHRIILMQQGLLYGIQVDWTEISHFIHKHDLSQNEKEFLTGFFSYYFACSKECAEKGKHFEEANALLRPFTGISPSARLAQAVICIYFNWLERLSLLCSGETSSNIAHIYGFLKRFHGTSLPLNYHTIEPRQNVKIFIDDEEHDNILAILAFVNGDMVCVENYLQRFNYNDTHLHKRNPFLTDRILLLKARHARVCGNQTKREILDYYEAIRLSPCFEQEIKDFRDEK